MKLASTKSVYPKTILPFAVSVGGLALFLIFASLLLVYQPIGIKVNTIVNIVDSSADKTVDSGINKNVDIITNKTADSVTNKTVDSATHETADSATDKTVDTATDQTVDSATDQSVDSGSNKNVDIITNKTADSVTNKTADSATDQTADSATDKTVDTATDQTVDSATDQTVDSSIDKSVDSATNKTVDSATNKTVDSDSASNKSVDSVGNKTIDLDTNKTIDLDTNKTVELDTNKTVDLDTNKTVDLDTNKTLDLDTNKTVGLDTNKNVDSDTNKNVDSDASKTADSGPDKTVDSGCDLYHGKWVHDSVGPLYSNNSCPVLSQMQNCQGNGRPDKDYENWRWQPSKCDLPRFDPKKFLELMRGKTLAFIGDSVARNQMESMLCILWQAEVPINRGNKRMQRYFFRSTSTTIIRIWSSWLVHKTTEQFDFAPESIDKLHLDAPDETFMGDVPTFDVLVLSSGHWFAKQSVYILNNEIVGGQLWWPDSSRKKKIDSTEAFEISVDTIMSSLVTHPNYNGLTVVRAYSPDHYEGGAWNTGGSCTGKEEPAEEGKLVESGFTNIMHDKQVSGFNRGIKKKTNKSRVAFMDITKPFAYRHDGHPGPYRSLDPNKITKRSANGQPPPQDCLHWCMPGPIDTWNEFLMETIRRDFEARDS
ncbi:protein YLS7 isoform X3 [Rutidosis leptorrhynchoides]|uniref:protein YLS7 isoform X3 n=1 Tax=Rutidosis leptorrhynchoides TaxID=125765 RepID=UPI003A9A3825